MEQATEQSQVQAVEDALVGDDLLAPTEKRLDTLLNASLEELGIDAPELVVPQKEKEVGNAARCKRHRAKQKETKERETIENLKLKRERTALLKTIADLQNEAQALRGERAVDFSLENALLKAEIQKHRQYIEAVVNLSKMGPVVSREEENMRLMKSGVESGVGQIVGLFYSSMSSNTWKEGEHLVLKLVNNEGGTSEVLMRFWYQYLPLGTTAKESQRINMRVDYYDIPRDANTMVEMGKDMMMNKWGSPNVAKQLQPHLDFEEIIPVQVLESGETLCCRRVKFNADGLKREEVAAQAYKMVSLFPAAFPENTEDDLVEPREYPIFVTSSCDLDIEPSEGCQRVREISSRGHIIVPRGNNRCMISVAQSSPTVHSLHEMCIKSGDFIVNDEGELSESYLNFVKRQWRLTLGVKVVVEKAGGQQLAQDL